MILLSVLIPSLPERLPVLRDLLDCLEKQKDPRMEVLVLTDNRMRQVGAKRNALTALARGAYVAHIDDDELLAPDYFAAVATELEHGVDVVAYDAGVSFNGSPEFRVKTVLGAACEHPRPLDGGGYSDITRPPWHWCAWRTDFARRFKFPEDYGWTEDWGFLKQALPEVRTHRKIDRVLFHHRWNQNTSTFTTAEKTPS